LGFQKKIKVKKIITKIFFSTLSSKEKVEKYQKIIRENEWNDISKYISKNSSFLDVGCGAGYAMYRAKVDFNCEVNGVDPDPGAHGVGRFIELFSKDEIHITKGFAEKLPFENEKFDVLYCSHVLEHVNDEQQAIIEMNRVLKDSGVAIIGMPSATMAFISLVSQIVFTTHIRIYDFFRRFFKRGTLKRFLKIFIIESHSKPRAKYIFYDLIHYRESNWKKIVETQFKITKVIRPFLYPYPDFPQWFKIRKSKNFSSSVFFICEKK
jgi:ubiquinone/menaquinone biosynthesis C-methylase UbiE